MIWNGAQFHLLVNHLPVVGFIGVIGALAIAMVIRSMDVKRFVLAATVIAGLSALAPFWTGEPAEETIEHLPGVDKALIEEHEEAAEYKERHFSNRVFRDLDEIVAAGVEAWQSLTADVVRSVCGVPWCPFEMSPPA